MRILLAHNYYKRPGGEDTVVANELALLAARGHEVKLFSDNNERISGPWKVLQTAWQISFSPTSRDAMRRVIADFSPDIVHVHNFFPLLTPSIYDPCRQQRIPVIQTLHNFRFLCAGAMLMRAGRPCEDCIGGSAYRALLHGCYQDSRLASLPVAHMIETHRRNKTWSTKIDRFIALTEFAKSRFVKAAVPPDMIAVKPNFTEDRAQVAGPREGALFVGRLSAEKGIHTMLRAWTGLDVPLCVAGDGPLAGDVHGAGIPALTALGAIPPDSVSSEMARAAFLVMPSEWYETFGLVIIEAFCQGLPVIASRLGAMAEIVENGVTGLLFTPGDASDLVAKVRWAAAHPDEMRQMGLNARRKYEKEYTPDANYRVLMDIYRQAIKGNHALYTG